MLTLNWPSGIYSAIDPDAPDTEQDTGAQHRRSEAYSSVVLACRVLFSKTCQPTGKLVSVDDLVRLCIAPSIFRLAPGTRVGCSHAV